MRLVTGKFIYKKSICLSNFRVIERKMFTGEFYRFYSNKGIDNIFSLFEEKISNFGYFSRRYFEPIAGDEVLFCFKDSDMFEYHSEHGYNLDIDGQGCFCVEAKQVKLRGAASLFEFENESDFAPYRINLILDNIFYYFLILPGVIEESKFCKKIYDHFVDSIKDA